MIRAATVDDAGDIATVHVRGWQASYSSSDQLDAVVAFVASTVIRMLLPWHEKDCKVLAADSLVDKLIARGVFGSLWP